MTDKPTLHGKLVEALSEMPNPVKNADNPAFKRDGKPMRYADLEATLEACKPVLAACGIGLIQMPCSNERGVGVHTILFGHGEVLDCGEFYLPLAKQDPQGGGSAITYARRYALTSILGLAQEDDDGNGASQPRTNGSSNGAIGSDAPIIRAIFGKKSALGISDEKFAATLKDDYGVEHPGDLTMENAKALADRLQAAIEEKAREG